MHNSEESRLSRVAIELCKIRNWHFVKFSGKGSFKETFQVTFDEQNFALKIFFPEYFDKERNIREIEAMKKCKSPNLCKIVEFGMFEMENTLYSFLVEDYLNGGTLSDLRVNYPYSYENLKIISNGLFNALECLKENNIVHRDIKPDNIMFVENSLVPIITDFGLVRDLNKDSMTPTWAMMGPGTPIYSSPEQLNNNKNILSWSSDQFSIGLVLGEYITGVHPFSDRTNNSNIVDSILSRRECSKEFVKNIEDLNLTQILKMLKPWPVQRYLKINDLKNLFV